MKPDIWNPKIDIVEIEGMSGANKDKVINEWIQNCINPLEIFNEFCKLPIVKAGLARYNPNELPNISKIHESISTIPSLTDNKRSRR